MRKTVCDRCGKTMSDAELALSAWVKIKLPQNMRFGNKDVWITRLALDPEEYSSIVEELCNACQRSIESALAKNAAYREGSMVWEGKRTRNLDCPLWLVWVILTVTLLVTALLGSLAATWAMEWF